MSTVDTTDLANSTELEHVGLGYRYTPLRDGKAPYGVVLSMDYIQGREGSLAGELLVQTLRGKHVHRSRLALSNLRDRMSMAGHLTDRSKRVNVELPWYEIIESFCTAVLDQERKGHPFERVGRLDGKVTYLPDLMEKLLVTGKVNSWYGEGGTGKGWLTAGVVVALALGIPFAGLKPYPETVESLYLDWEDSAFELDSRVKAVARGMGVQPFDVPEVHYRRMVNPLTASIHEVVAYVREHNIGFVVVDSTEMAMDAGDFGPSGIKSLYRALRQLEPATVLLIDHVAAKSEEAREAGKLSGKAYGSTYKMNEVRNAWELNKEQEYGAADQLIGWSHTKGNGRRRHRPFALRLRFEAANEDAPADRVTFERAEIADTATLSKTLALADRIAAEVRLGPLAVAQIADRLDLGKGGEDKVRNALNRGHGKRFTKLPDGTWALLDQPYRTTVVHEVTMNGVVPHEDAELALPF